MFTILEIAMILFLPPIESNHSSKPRAHKLIKLFCQNDFVLIEVVNLRLLIQDGSPAPTIEAALLHSPTVNTPTQFCMAQTCNITVSVPLSTLI